MDKESERKMVLRAQCRRVKPLLEAILDGQDLEAKNINDEWVLCKPFYFSLEEIVREPEMFRVGQ